jgi:hypothetical protein
MAATAGHRRNVHKVELGLETRIALDKAERHDQNEDEARGRARRYTRGLLNALQQEQHFDDLGDVERHRAKELVTELCGLLDGVPEQGVLIPIVALSGGASSESRPARSIPGSTEAPPLRAKGRMAR